VIKFLTHTVEDIFFPNFIAMNVSASDSDAAAVPLTHSDFAECILICYN